jgi:hypothetical protein
MISIFTDRGSGEFAKSLERTKEAIRFADRVLNRYGQKGVHALAQATPKRTGKTSESWGYRIVKGPTSTTIEWYNTNATPGYSPVAVLIQFGHGTRNGGYVNGVDYINPATAKIFEQLAQDLWKEMTK